MIKQKIRRWADSLLTLGYSLVSRDRAKALQAP